MGFQFAADRCADDVLPAADRQENASAIMQALSGAVYRQPTERGVLQSGLQE